MSHIIECPNCAKHYQVADSSLGKGVRCQQCGATFTVAIAATSSPSAPQSDSDPFDLLAGVDLSQFPTVPTSVPSHGGANPLGSYAGSNPGSAGVSNPSGGPTDARMRLAACGSLAFGIVLIVGSLVLQAVTGSVFMIVLGLVPLMFVLGITGLISPDVVRAIGQYGGHLPSYYKIIGRGLLGSSILLIFPIMIGLYVAGYRTDTPRPRPRVRQVNPVSPAYNPAPPAKVPLATAGKKVAHKNDVGAKEIPNGMKRRKSYPVSIDVPEHSVVVPPNAKLTPGTRLEACWSDKWNPITTLSENEDGSLDVRWDDFGEKFDCSMVRAELIIRKEVLNPSAQLANAPSSAATPRPETAIDAGSVDSKPKPLKAYPVTIAVPSDSQFVPADAKLQPGTRLQACWAGKWNPITFLSANNDGTLTVRWDDFGAAFDCSMTRDELIIKQDGLK
ncbi:MAG: hypothetical protein O3C40_10820 [Planctomycetota bacterium]|nr:hypothetical protein [Planctomycetota bacterium]